MSKMRCGVVGAGNWMRAALLPALHARSDCAVVGCAAGSLEEAEAFAREQKIDRAFRSLDAMLAELGRLDLVVLATPDHVHASGITSAIEAGVAVYCEKPLANDRGSAIGLVDLVRAKPVPATVGFSFRFNPAVQKLQRDLRAGRLGEPWLIELTEHNPQFHPANGRAMTWKGDPAMAGGGALFEYGSHIIDLAGWFMGPIRRVASRLQKVRPDAKLDDIATLQLEFKSAASGTLLASWVLDGGFPGIHVRIHGSKALGEIWLDHRLPGGQRYRVTPSFGGEAGDVDLAPMKTDRRTDAAGRHIDDFVASIQKQPPAHSDTLPTLEDGAEVQRVLEAALRATDRWMMVE